MVGLLRIAERFLVFTELVEEIIHPHRVVVLVLLALLQDLGCLGVVGGRTYRIFVGIAFESEIDRKTEQELDREEESIQVDLLPADDFRHAILILVVLDSFHDMKCLNALGDDHLFPEVIRFFAPSKDEVEHVDKKLLGFPVHVFVRPLLYILLDQLLLFFVFLYLGVASLLVEFFVSLHFELAGELFSLLQLLVFGLL